jgi:hypothetical protein
MDQQRNAIIEILAQSLNEQVVTGLTVAFDAGVKHERSRMLEDDEQASDIRRLLSTLERMLSAGQEEWRVVYDMTDNTAARVVYTRIVGPDQITVIVADKLTSDMAQFIVRVHNNLGKLISLSRLGLDARAHPRG